MLILKYFVKFFFLLINFILASSRGMRAESRLKNKTKLVLILDDEEEEPERIIEYSEPKLDEEDLKNLNKNRPKRVINFKFNLKILVWLFFVKKRSIDNLQILILLYI